MDNNVKKLADLLVNYSCDLQAGEKILIDYEGTVTKPLVRQLVKEVYAKGGIPFIAHRDSQITRELLLHCNEEQMQFQAAIDLEKMKNMDAYIAIRAGENISELADVPSDKMKIYNESTHELLEYRVNNTKWVVLRYPSPSMAQQACMSQEAFEEFYFKVCTLDYKRMGDAMECLVKLMNKTDKVRLIAKDTDLTFSIKDIGAVKCCGERNIPDGEVYSAPVKNSMNGYISYNTPSLEDGFTFENIRFDIENGKIIKATCNNNERINNLLDTDEGSRYFGEFAIGVNPYVLTPMKDTLFDEKIAGSIHLTPGMCYEDAYNGNTSAVHWDLVLIQRPEYGGGEIWFDNVLIRKDGIFVIPELECLNPENLK